MDKHYVSTLTYFSIYLCYSFLKKENGIMGDIILFPQKEKRNMKRRETMNSKYESIVMSLEDNPANEYNIKQAEELADKVLKAGGYFDIQAPLPIVNVASQFDFSVFKQPKMKKNEAGNIYIGGKTNSVYGTDKVIIVGDQEEYFHQRFIIAHELGHYLMDYINDPKLRDDSQLFSRAYLRSSHDNSDEELRADRFAAELLMPAHIFVPQYIRATEKYYDRTYTISYLSNFFKTKKSSIEKRIIEVMNNAFTY